MNESIKRSKLPYLFYLNPLWFYVGLSVEISQLVSRVFTKEFWSIYCCSVGVSVGELGSNASYSDILLTSL